MFSTCGSSGRSQAMGSLSASARRKTCHVRMRASIRNKASPNEVSFCETCVGNNECEGHCSNDVAEFCTVGDDFECGEGHCSVTTTTLCNSSAQCISPETCVFPAMCLAGVCDGSVCSENEVTVDYCTGALQALPDAP